MRVILISVTKDEREVIKIKVFLMIKTIVQQNQKVGEIFSMLRREAGSVGFVWCLIRRVVPIAPPVRQNNHGAKGN